MAKSVAQRMQDAGLPYEVTDNLAFVLSGGISVVAIYHYAGASRQFAGFYGIVEAGRVAKDVQGMRGVHAVYVNNPNRKD